MTKTLMLFILICFVICSCGNPKMAKDNAAQNNPANYKTDIAKLNDILGQYEEPSQITKISAEKPGIVTGRNGTKISINPNDLVTISGNPLGQTIAVELKELTNQGQLLRTNTQTVSDGKLLVSGGAYFIGMTSNGEQLKLRDGKSLNVQFPKLSDQKMALFYGQRDDLGQINWQNSMQPFKRTQQPQPVAKEGVSTTGKSEIDAIMDYVNGDTTTEEGKKDRAQWKAEAKAERQLYDAMEIANLGWINCDRFLEEKNKTDLNIFFNSQDSVKSASIYLVFKDINSVTQTLYYADQLPHFTDVPVGYKVRLIAYTVKEEKIFSYTKDLTITKGQNETINFKEISEQDFKKLLNK